MIEGGFAPNVWSHNIQIEGYCKIKRVDEAKSLYNDVFQENSSK